MKTPSKHIAVVTGAAGFIGSHMVDLLLAEGFNVRGIDNLTGGSLRNIAHLSGNSHFDLERRDIRELTPKDKLFNDARFVFHFAGIGDIVPSIERPLDYMSVNTQGTAHVLEAARSAGTVEKLVYAASSSCYGLATELPTTESSPIKPQYPYALSKWLGEIEAMHWNQVYGLPVNSIRIFNAYGPRSRTTGAYGAVFGVFLAQKLAGKPFTVVGDGKQARDFVFVSDVAHAFLAAARTQRSGEIYNIGAGDPQTVNTLVRILGGEEYGVTYIPKRPGEPDCTWADITKAKTHLEWSPKVGFAEGVGQMLDHLDYWKDAPVWDEDSIARATKSWFDYLAEKQ